jgi:osmotically-inducible protein OsmY
MVEPATSEHHESAELLRIGKDGQVRKPDNILEKDVRDELSYDPWLDDTQISVKADDGRVSLTGAVPSYAELVEASDDAWSVKGVTSVDNELLVGLVGEALADADIASRCIDAIGSERLVPKGAVTVDVLDGWVMLSGHVRHHFQRQAAKFAAQRVKGVRGITDNITISTEPIPSDVAQRITDALNRKAVLDDSVIQVINDGSIIYLDGTTDSYTAMQTAEDTAWAAPGVTDVVDRLVVVP